jgi:hypothetical protein
MATTGQRKSLARHSFMEASRHPLAIDRAFFFAIHPPSRNARAFAELAG